MLTTTEIARKAGLSKTSLKKYYLITGDIYKAIEMYKQKPNRTRRRLHCREL